MATTANSTARIIQTGRPVISENSLLSPTGSKTTVE